MVEFQQELTTSLLTGIALRCTNAFQLIVLQHPNSRVGNWWSPVGAIVHNHNPFPVREGLGNEAVEALVQKRRTVAGREDADAWFGVTHFFGCKMIVAGTLVSSSGEIAMARRINVRPCASLPAW